MARTARPSVSGRAGSLGWIARSNMVRRGLSAARAHEYRMTPNRWREKRVQAHPVQRPWKELAQNQRGIGSRWRWLPYGRRSPIAAGQDVSNPKDYSAISSTASARRMLYEQMPQRTTWDRDPLIRSLPLCRSQRRAVAGFGKALFDFLSAALQIGLAASANDWSRPPVLLHDSVSWRAHPTTRRSLL